MSERIMNRRNKLDFPTDRGLTHRGVIYIPSTRDVDRPISRQALQKRINLVSRAIANTFGGSTVQRKAFGKWVDEDGNLVGEEIARIEFFTDRKSYLANDHKIGKIIQRLKKKWGQEAIAYEYESPKKSRALHFIM